ncbi:MAG: hypothetical protein ACREHG_07720, partial [Candidatus Saccharimonadales bacterium]
AKSWGLGTWAANTFPQSSHQWKRQGEKRSADDCEFNELAARGRDEVTRRLKLINSQPEEGMRSPDGCKFSELAAGEWGFANVWEMVG